MKAISVQIYFSTFFIIFIVFNLQSIIIWHNLHYLKIFYNHCQLFSGGEKYVFIYFPQRVYSPLASLSAQQIFHSSSDTRYFDVDLFHLLPLRGRWQKKGSQQGKRLGFIYPWVDNNTWCSAVKCHGRKQRIWTAYKILDWKWNNLLRQEKFRLHMIQKDAQVHPCIY